MRNRISVTLCLVALAALPTAAQTINACADTGKGTLRVLKAGDSCDNKEFAVSWNIQGLSGRDGANGVNGMNGRDGRDGLNCEPAGPAAPQQVGTVNFTPPSGTAFAIYQFSGGVKNLGTVSSGGGGGAGKAEFSPVVLVRKVDLASPGVFQDVAEGQHIAQILIGLSQPAGAPAASIKLFDVITAGYVLGRLDGSNDLFETITFDFTKIEFTIGGAKGCYDLKLEKKC